MKAVDYSTARPTIGELQVNGIGAVLRYVGPPTWAKCITQAEYDALIAGDIEVQLVFEDQATDAAGGFQAGVRNAQLAEQYLPAGYPLDFPVYFAVDEDLSGADLETAVAYIAGASAVLGPNRTGDYGEGELLVTTAAAGTAKWHWQSGSTSFPGSATVGPEVDVVQGLGGPIGGTDADTVIHDPISPPASPAPTNEEAPMLATFTQTGTNAEGREYTAAKHTLSADPSGAVEHRMQLVSPAGEVGPELKLTVATVENAVGIAGGVDSFGTLDCYVQVAGAVEHWDFPAGKSWQPVAGWNN